MRLTSSCDELTIMVTTAATWPWQRGSNVWRTAQSGGLWNSPNDRFWIQYPQSFDEDDGRSFGSLPDRADDRFGMGGVAH